jgi:2-polyprenyl-3-methyl-5-hydroxy-6-metoxy-1,4-benzoquinol methylase
MERNKIESVHIDYNAKSEPYHEVIADLVCDFIKDGASVLDIGCGLGYTISEIKKRKPKLKITAADIDRECLRITKQKTDLDKMIHLRAIEDLFTIPLKFDAIIMSHVLEHLYRPVDTILEIFKMLNSGGRLVLAVPNPVRPYVIISNFIKKHYVNRGHVYAWDRSHWKNLIENILHADVLCYSQDFVELPLLHRFHFIRQFEKSLANILPWFAFSNIAVIKAASHIKI